MERRPSPSLTRASKSHPKDSSCSPTSRPAKPSSSAGSAEPPSSSVPACLAEQFPSFDLSVLSPKQLAVVEMRLCGGLSFRKIAAFEGVTCTPVVNRYQRALRILGSTFRA